MIKNLSKFSLPILRIDTGVYTLVSTNIDNSERLGRLLWYYITGLLDTLVVVSHLISTLAVTKYVD